MADALKTAQDIIDLIVADEARRRIIDAVAGLSLPDWGIGAGFVRAAVWDHLHSYQTPTVLDDIDVVYFDPERCGIDADEALERELGMIMPDVPWSVHNQARMHRRNSDPPYKNTEHALAFWLEVATCVAITKTPHGTHHLICPYGVDDLVGLRVRPTPAAQRKPQAYLRRLQQKAWVKIWPKLTVQLPDDCLN